MRVSLALEIKEMSKSNYEKYAEVKQQELLHKERNLQQAISCLRDVKHDRKMESTGDCTIS